MLELSNPGGRFYAPDGTGFDEALARTTHLGVGAHADDLPIMALDGIGRCFGRTDRWFTGITVTDGGGSPRAGRYADYSDEQMREARIREETQAAAAGAYSAAVLLDYPSSAVTTSSSPEVIADLAAVIAGARPRTVYTHNLADKHETHVAVALRTVAAIRSLRREVRPTALYGCEVWRDLDWMADGDKVVFDVTGYQAISSRVLGAYPSQIDGGKRYDLASSGRRLAHATFSATHEIGHARAFIYAMDLTPLIVDDVVQAERHVAAHVERMRHEIVDQIERLR